MWLVRTLIWGRRGDRQEFEPSTSYTEARGQCHLHYHLVAHSCDELPCQETKRYTLFSRYCFSKAMGHKFHYSGESYGREEPRLRRTGCKLFF